jgi:hypothetical protein
MEKRHEEYVVYYEARMKKFEGNPTYARTYAAEKKLYETIRDVPKLEDFRTVVEKDHPEVQCAIALVKDQESARLAHFKKLEEDVRAISPERILKEIDQAKTAIEVANTVSKIDQETGLLISIDQFMDGFYNDFDMLENLAVMEAIRNDLPKEWQQEITDEIKETLEKQKDFYAAHTRANNRNYKADWEYDYALVWKTRHRRRIPFPDEIVKRRIDEHKRYNGIA